MIRSPLSHHCFSWGHLCRLRSFSLPAVQGHNHQQCLNNHRRGFHHEQCLKSCWSDVFVGASTWCYLSTSTNLYVFFFWENLSFDCLSCLNLDPWYRPCWIVLATFHPHRSNFPKQFFNPENNLTVWLVTYPEVIWNGKNRCHFLPRPKAERFWALERTVPKKIMVTMVANFK